MTSSSGNSIIRQIAWNTITGWIALSVNGILSLALVPYLIRELGEGLYGLAAITASIVAIVGLFDLGFHKGISRQLAAAEAHNDYEEYDRLVSSGLVSLGVISLVLTAAIIILADPLAHVLKIQTGLLPQAVLAIRVLGGISILEQFISPLFTGIITSKNRFDFINIANPIVSLIRSLLLLFVVVWMQGGFEWWLYVMALEHLLRLVSLMVLARRVDRNWRVNLSSVTFSAIFSIFSVGGYMFLSQISFLLSSKADPLILSRFLGPASVAQYSPALQLVSFASPFVQMLNNQLHPLATLFNERDRIASLRSLLLRGTRYGGLMGTLVCVFLFVYSREICQIWLGGSLPDSWPVVASVLRWWVISEYTTYLASAQWPVILGMNKLRFLATTQVPFAILNIIGSIYLVGWTNLGVVGVVIPTALVGVIRRPIIFWYCNKITLTTFRELWREALSPLSIVLCCLGVLALGLQQIYKPTSWFDLAISGVLLGIGWSVLVLFTARPVDRDLFKIYCTRFFLKAGKK